MVRHEWCKDRHSDDVARVGRKEVQSKGRHACVRGATSRSRVRLLFEHGAPKVEPRTGAEELAVEGCLTGGLGTASHQPHGGPGSARGPHIVPGDGPHQCSHFEGSHGHNIPTGVVHPAGKAEGRQLVEGGADLADKHEHSRRRSQWAVAPHSMSHFRRLWFSQTRTMSAPGNLEDHFLILAQCVDGMGGPFSDMLRRSAAVRLVKLEPGVSLEHVFPIRACFRH